jgi:hypothetical protein
MDKMYLCEHCRTSSLSFDAEAFWDISEQKFKFNFNKNRFDNKQAFCGVCDTWVTFYEYETDPEENGYSSIELDIEKYDKETLVNLILFAHKNNYTFNQAVNEFLKTVIEKHEIQD